MFLELKQFQRLRATVLMFAKFRCSSLVHMFCDDGLGFTMHNFGVKIFDFFSKHQADISVFREPNEGL